MRFHAILIDFLHADLITRLAPELDQDKNQNNWLLVPEHKGEPSVVTPAEFYARFGEERRRTHSKITIQVVQD